ncbi:MAG: sugar ABC transporter permease, partial [Spirochaetales bacterium]|nr:sugar ABC transporter permease [Spirochaetales bacterium]
MYIGNERQKRWAVAIFLFPSLLGLMVFFLLPIFSSLVISFLEYDPLKPLSAIKFLGIDNFKKYLTTRDLANQYSHVFYYMGLYIPLVLFTSLCEALILSKSFKAKKLYKIMLYIPVLTSWVAVALIWRWLLNGRYGLINDWLQVIGITGPAWLTNRYWAMPGIVIAAVWKDTGYYALIILAALKGINSTYYEVAQIDGASRWNQFSRITLPLISPTIFLLVVVNVINGFQVFESIFIMTEGGPAGATRVPVEQVYRNAFTYFNMGYASAISWILFIVIFIATVAQFRLQK